MIFIAIIILICIIYYKYNNIEEFNVNRLSFLSLDAENYPDIPNDHYYYNNPPFTDDNGMALNTKSGGKYCNDNKTVPYRQNRNYEISCGGANNTVNQLFSVNTDGLTEEAVNRANTNINRFNNETMELLSGELDKLISRYVELKDEITFAKKFLDENQYSSNKYREYNKKLSNNLDKQNQDINSNMQRTTILKESHDSKIERKYTLINYSRYILIVIGLTTIIYLFMKQYNVNEPAKNKLQFNNNKLSGNNTLKA